MKIVDVNNELIGKKVKGVFTALAVTGVIVGIVDDKYSKGVEIKLDNPVTWGDHQYTSYTSTARKCDEFGNLQYTELI